MSLDLILGIVLVWGFYQGYAHGIIQTVFNFAGYFFGLMIAFKMTATTTNMLNQLFHTDNPLMFVAGFLVMFVLIMMVFRVASRGLEGFFNFAHAGSINQIAGGALLGTIYVMLFSILVWFANKANLIDESTKRTARSWPLLEALPPKAKIVAERVSPIVKDFWNSSINMVDRLDKYGVQKTESNQRVYDLPKPTPTGQDIFTPYSDRPTKEN